MVDLLLAHAKRELEKFRAERDPDEARASARQAAEKAWGYLVDLVNVAGRIEGGSRDAHARRLVFLTELDLKARTRLKPTYTRIRDTLHGDCFYEGVCVLKELDELLAAVESFPENLREAKRLVKERERHVGEA